MEIYKYLERENLEEIKGGASTTGQLINAEWTFLKRKKAFKAESRKQRRRERIDSETIIERGGLRLIRALDESTANDLQNDSKDNILFIKDYEGKFKRTGT